MNARVESGMNVLIGIEDEDLGEAVVEFLEQWEESDCFNIHTVSGSLAGLAELGGVHGDPFRPELLIYDYELYAFCKNRTVEAVSTNVAGRIAMIVIAYGDVEKRLPIHGYDSNKMLIEFVDAPFSFPGEFKSAIMRCLNFIGRVAVND